MKREDNRRLTVETAGEEAYIGWLTENLTELPAATAPAGLAAAVQQRTGMPRERLAVAAFRLPILDLATVTTPVGELHLAYGPLGIVRTRLGGPAAAFAGEVESLGATVAWHDAAPAHFGRLVDDFFAGKPVPLSAFDLRGRGEFERRVLAQALTIPWGEVRPYSWLAREVGSPGSARAVGQALGRNPVAPLIPCHRAVRRDGGLGGYAFGLPLKRRLLEQEGIDLANLEYLATVGLRYLGSRTTHIYCYPTCRHARRIQPDNQALFRDEAQALAAGFRPCRVCRP
ncbi:MAG: methylated-DNA--[protein]-cysteine S-methyltransferase [Chloroflexota bacterium]